MVIPGYFLNKFLPRKEDVRTGGGAAELNYRQNSYIIRLADTYLMEAEALGSGARAQALLDAVRSRVGLPSVPVTLAAIKNDYDKIRLPLFMKKHTKLHRTTYCFICIIIVWFFLFY